MSLQAASKIPGMAEFAKQRTAIILKNGINFDIGLRELIAAAYMAGFSDCVDCLDAETESK